MPLVHGRVSEAFDDSECGGIDPLLSDVDYAILISIYTVQSCHASTASSRALSFVFYIGT
jgi:hypothetical protein